MGVCFRHSPDAQVQAFCEIRGVLVNGVGTFIPAVLPFFRPQAKARAKCRSRQAGK
jgi:hypothetical protein